MIYLESAALFLPEAQDIFQIKMAWLYIQANRPEQAEPILQQFSASHAYPNIRRWAQKWRAQAAIHSNSFLNGNTKNTPQVNWDWNKALQEADRYLLLRRLDLADALLQELKKHIDTLAKAQQWALRESRRLFRHQKISEAILLLQGSGLPWQYEKVATFYTNMLLLQNQPQEATAVWEHWAHKYPSQRDKYEYQAALTLLYGKQPEAAKRWLASTLDWQTQQKRLGKEQSCHVLWAQVMLALKLKQPSELKNLLSPETHWHTLCETHEREHTFWYLWANYTDSDQKAQNSLCARLKARAYDYYGVLGAALCGENGNWISQLAHPQAPVASDNRIELQQLEVLPLLTQERIRLWVALDLPEGLESELILQQISPQDASTPHHAFAQSGVYTPRCQQNTEHHQRCLEAAYPRAFFSQVQEAAQRHGISPYLLWAIMRQESGFNPTALSKTGAMGLMQLMPMTQEKIENHLQKSQITEEAPPALAYNTAISQNINESAWYLSKLLESFDQNPLLAIAAYNAGPLATARWADLFAEESTQIWIEFIPWTETQQYVKKVFANWIVYLHLYEGKDAALDAQKVLNTSVRPPLQLAVDF